MTIRRIKLKGVTVFEVDLYTSGRDSKRIRKRFKKRIEAEKYLKNYLVEESNYKASGISINLLEEVVLKDEINFWLENSKHFFSATHLKRVEGIVKEIMPIFGNLTLDQLTAARLTQYQKELKARRQANATVNRKIEVILTTLNHSVRHRRIPYNPTLGLKKLPSKGKEMEFWSMESASSFLSFCSDKYPKNSSSRWIYVCYLLALNTGLRAGEIRGLKPIDIDPETLFIRRQYNRLTMSFDILKGKNNSKNGKLSRRVPCNSKLYIGLKDWIKFNLIKDTETIFLNQNRLPIDHDNFRNRIFWKDLKEWGGEVIRFHDFRHTAITQMIAAGIDIKTVQSIAGHEDIKTTMNYVHVVGNKIKEVAKTFSISDESQKPATILKLVE
jgi:integrase